MFGHFPGGLLVMIAILVVFAVFARAFQPVLNAVGLVIGLTGTAIGVIAAVLGLFAAIFAGVAGWTGSNQFAHLATVILALAAGVMLFLGARLARRRWLRKRGEARASAAPQD